jgi:hypothetical protein
MLELGLVNVGKLISKYISLLGPDYTFALLYGQNREILLAIEDGFGARSAVASIWIAEWFAIGAAYHAVASMYSQLISYERN